LMLHTNQTGCGRGDEDDVSTIVGPPGTSSPCRCC
jgi:hypothetical protein